MIARILLTSVILLSTYQNAVAEDNKAVFNIINKSNATLRIGGVFEDCDDNHHCQVVKTNVVLMCTNADETESTKENHYLLDTLESFKNQHLLQFGEKTDETLEPVTGKTQLTVDMNVYLTEWSKKITCPNADKILSVDIFQFVEENKKTWQQLNISGCSIDFLVQDAGFPEAKANIVFSRVEADKWGLPFDWRNHPFWFTYLYAQPIQCNITDDHTITITNADSQ